MAFAALNLAGHIWSEAGLRYLLLSHDAPPGTGFCQPARSAHPGNAWTGRKHVPVKQAASKPEPAREMPAAQKTSAAWQPKPMPEWPAIWQKQFSRTKKAQFAWVWWHLGLDLLASGCSRDAFCGDENERKERSALLKKFLADLAHPAGTHTFWPICMPCGAENLLTPDFDCFWSGIQLLQCRGVILMGSPAAREAMAVNDLKPLMQLRKFGKFVWILWDPNVIASRPGVYDRALGWLRISLKPFIRS